MPFPVKICGITRPEDALLAEALGAFAVGFIFYPKSPRYIAPSRARTISRRLGPDILRVGVFVDEDISKVFETARKAELTAIQLHGVEEPEYIRKLGEIPVIKAFRVGVEFDPGCLRKHPADYYLLDAAVAGSHGGTGKTFDWSLAANCTRCGKIILAGGLHAENVAEAIQTVRPWGVDISSGVESRPGIKDAVKMRRVFEALPPCK
jgi:phosphoribosylanthranilate isomerase